MKTFTDTQKLACDISRNIAVTAGAGSGKTSVLVERYLWCLRNNDYQVPRIVAITFTEKAAAEMLSRVRERILDYATSETLGDPIRWEEVLERLPLANISTIHSFCQRLLREFPIEAGVDPNFDVLDESVKRILLHRLIDDVIQEHSAAHDAHLITLAELWSPYTLKQVLLELIEQRDAGVPWAQSIRNESLPDYVDRVSSFVRSLTQRGVQRILVSPEWQRAIQDIHDVVPEGDSSKLTSRSLNILEYDQEFRAQTRLEDQVLTLQMLYKDCRMVTPSARWKEDGRNVRLKEAFQQLKSVYDACLPSIAFNKALESSGFGLQQALGELFLIVYARYQQEKTERSVLDFDDLQEKALQLLQQPDIHAVLSRRYDYVMVDEFQDTNQLQWEIIQRLGMTEQGLAPHKFCVVGDEKQSIYMFRGAEVAVFHDVRQELQQVNLVNHVVDTPPLLPSLGDPPQIQEEQKCGELVMAENFRSTPHILFFLNALFSKIFLPAWDRDRPFHVPHQELRPGKKEAIEKPVLQEENIELPAPVEFLLVEPVDVDIVDMAETSPEILLTEPELVALRIRELTASFRYADIAILLRTRTRLKEFEEALRQHDIPFVVAGGIGFFQQQELYDIANLLRVLVDTRQDIALAGVLRSPLLAFSDDQLLFLRTPPESTQPNGISLWQQLAYHAERSAGISEELSPDQFVYAHQLLHSWKALANRIPITHLLRRILDDTGFPGIIAGDRKETQTALNIEKLLDVARTFEQEGFQTLHDFVLLLDNLIELEERESEAQLNVEGMDVVRLMTIHAAKGLEFPVVFVPELERPFNYGVGTSVYIDMIDVAGTKRPVVGLKGLLPDKQGSAEDTVFRSALQHLNREKTDAEMQRLLYVACTRAARHLILTGDLSKKSSPSSWMAWLLNLLPIQESIPQQEFTLTDDAHADDAKTFYAPHALTIPVRTSRAYASTHTAPRTVPELPAVFSSFLESPVDTSQADSEVFGQVHSLLNRNLRPVKENGDEYVRISPSTIHLLFQCPRKYYYQQVLKLPDYASDAMTPPHFSDDFSEPTSGYTVGGKERGTLLHRLFEEQVFETEQSEAAVLDAANVVLDRMGISGRMRCEMDLNTLILRAAHHYQQTGLRERLNRSPKIYREYSFTLRERQLEISGTLDVLFLDADRQHWNILDYKSNEITAEQVEDEIVRHRYDIQMQLYALAVSRILHADSPRSLVFFTVPGVVYDAVDLSPAALETLLDNIERRITDMHNDRFKPTEGELPCDECGYSAYAECPASAGVFA